MVDKSHCIINMEDEDEYIDYYDFSKTYENHPLLIKSEGEGEEPVASIKPEEESKKAKEGGDDEDSWDDCGDLEDEDMKSNEEEKDDPSFEVVNGSEGEAKKKAPVGDETSDSFVVVDSTSTATDGTETKKAGTGKTREEVFLGLNIKKAKLLPSGEVELGNGKVMGTRKFHYIYKQKPRLPDTRECVLVNKIAQEYRKLRALQNGGVGDSLFRGDLNVKEFKGRVLQ